MRKEEAIRLLDGVFLSPFHPGRFESFILEIFNDFRVSPMRVPVWREYSDYVDEAHRIGIYSDGTHTLGVLRVRLKKATSRDRARTMQRNFVAKYLEMEGNDAVLVAFYGDDHDDWRFSFVRLEYGIGTGDDGKICVERKLTPARRFSFLVGKNEPNHTCRERFLGLVEEERKNPSLEDVEECFSVENVTKEFFEKYKGLYLRVKESLEEVLVADPVCQAEFSEKEITTVDFSKKLLGQIVFLYFLQKKGWLGVGKDPETRRFREWGTGPKDFMRRLYEGEVVPYENFFNDILEPLFYEALAEDRSINEDYYSRFGCKIPFLNGGLFEPIQNYNWVSVNLRIKNEVFGDILDTFDQFNFTIKEDEPLEREVAVDPEMLGKVFENLLDVIDRKSKGAFYTPREIVHYMCQQSLIGYLANHAEIPRPDLEQFIRHGDVALGMTIRAQEAGGQVEAWQDARFVLPDSIQDHYAELDHLLASVKVADPAVGSGAFPVGMMNEIVKARSSLTPFFSGEGAGRSVYDLKRQTIEESLYGVDIDSSAVDITKLRFWLSLIVDEENIQTIRPLPNLDHRIMCGNSLVDEFEGVSLFDEGLLSVPDEDPAALTAPIDAQIEELGRRLHAIATGAQAGDPGGVRREIARLERKRKEIRAGSGQRGGAQQVTFDQALSHRVTESRRKLRELKRYQRLYFNEQNRSKKNEYRSCIERLEWDLIEETLKESGRTDACRKLAAYRRNRSKPFFLWKLYFSEVFQRSNPGFDVVIANPPYVRQEELGSDFKEYLKDHYSCYTGVADLYVYFIERGHEILREDGVFCYITSNKYMKTKYGTKLREYLASISEIREIIDFGELPVFKSASTFPAILYTFKHPIPEQRVRFAQIKQLGYSSLAEEFEKLSIILADGAIAGSNWTIATPAEVKLLDKINASGIALGEYVGGSIFYGIKTGFNPAFIINESTKTRLIEEDSSSADVIVPFIVGDYVRKYRINYKNQYLLFIPWHFPLHNDKSIKGASKEAETEFKRNYPAIYGHLSQYFEKLSQRNKAETGKRYEWYALQRYGSNYYSEFSKPKITYPIIAKEPRFTYDELGYYSNDKTFIISSTDKYLLGLLNSKLIWLYLKRTCSCLGDPDKGGRLELRDIYMRYVPIRPIDPANPADVTRRDRIVALVESLLAMNRTLAGSVSPAERARLEAACAEADAEIDRIVYALYGLTEEEIAIVEGTG